MFRDDSRYNLGELYKDASNRSYTGLRGRILFADTDDIVPHVIEAGDTLWSLADRYYGGLIDNDVNYWWAIADFQPEPINDPTIMLVPGQIILIPPLETIVAALEEYPDEPLAELT
jgi:hypothetical protein